MQYFMPVSNTNSSSKYPDEDHIKQLYNDQNNYEMPLHKDYEDSNDNLFWHVDNKRNSDYAADMKAFLYEIMKYLDANTFLVVKPEDIHECTQANKTIKAFVAKAKQCGFIAQVSVDFPDTLDNFKFITKKGSSWVFTEITDLGIKYALSQA